MKDGIFRHLYSQIVIPLVLAALAVGAAATFLAVYFLSNVTDSWVDEVADGVRRNLVNRIESRSEAMQSLVRVLSQNPGITEALATGDADVVEAELAASGVTQDFDNLMLVDSRGMVFATAGAVDVAAGDLLPRPDLYGPLDAGVTSSVFLDLGGVLTLTSMHPVEGPDGRRYALYLSERMDDQFLRDLTDEAGCGSGFYNEDLEPVVWEVPAQCLEDGVGEDAVAVLAEAFQGPEHGIAAALQEAAIEGEGHAVMSAPCGEYQAVAQRVELVEGGEGGSAGYLVSLISMQVSSDARDTTTNLITMWSIVAVLALVGLGGWVARRVSDPLVSLTEGARRIAGGDFSTRIEMAGRNEITDLADSFNQMTESLRDRSESLTKKVLELATLYEMSRSLGTTLDLNTLLESVLDSALRIFGADLGYVTMRDKDSGELGIKASSGAVPSRIDDRALRSSMSEWVIRESRPLVFNPTNEEPKGQVEVVTGAMAALCVPLISSEGTIGAITVGSQDPEFRFGSDDVRLLSTIANHVTMAVGNIDLFSSLQDAYLATVRSLAAAVDAKDPYTRGHSDKVAVYATMVAEEMGLSHEQRVALEMAAYLHDIGKIGVKEAILLKPGKLTEEEMSQMRHHPLIGANILKPVAFPWPIVPMVRHHHEWWGGDGYPAGLKGEEIPLLARVLTVADAFEAMISDRPYRRGRTMDEGVEELQRCAGEQFDPSVVDAMVKALEKRAAEAGIETGEQADEEIAADEARAIFVALTEGMLRSFTRLGGPRLAANAESDLNARFALEGVPFSVSSGRIGVPHSSGNGEDADLESMRRALRLVDHTLGGLSGHALVDHFYADATTTLSDRMRCIAVRAEFIPD